MNASKQASRPEPYFLADHGALDLLNSVASVDGETHDFWQSDEDVRQWLLLSGLVQVPAALEFESGALLTEARALREALRLQVENRKAGKPVSVEGLNRFLAQSPSYIQISQMDDGGLRTERIYRQQTPAQLLGPVAELVASLLVEGNFDLIRVCEHPDCTLWFYDRTKAHRRRWCSMALCGNRAKVAKFRRQQK
ncbi:CGNR zinc finger domain-containing protein [Microbulbifer hainanensis]|uniref:CGNR zinc finger domain-containing protein n=1 Tax=Microbulbifer hainanensis TaxID=2735675 RepID=UPI0018677014|nr:ABATE domain-containing protein [Microbulbifer hainanensis]